MENKEALEKALELIKDRRRTSAGLGSIQSLIQHVLNSPQIAGVEMKIAYEDLFGTEVEVPVTGCCEVGPVFVSSNKYCNNCGAKIIYPKPQNP